MKIPCHELFPLYLSCLCYTNLAARSKEKTKKKAPSAMQNACRKYSLSKSTSIKRKDNPNTPKLRSKFCLSVCLSLRPSFLYASMQYANKRNSWIVHTYIYICREIEYWPGYICLSGHFTSTATGISFLFSTSSVKGALSLHTSWHATIQHPPSSTPIIQFQVPRGVHYNLSEGCTWHIPAKQWPYKYIYITV